MKPVYLFFAFINHLKTSFRIKVFQKRFFVFNKTGKNFTFKKNDEKILVVIAHVVPGAESGSEEKLLRLVACMDALGKSLASLQSDIVILTKENFSLHEKLPGYLKQKTEIFYSQQEDPMFVEYDAYDVFISHLKTHDYFLFLEDDVLLTDSWFLEKIKKFNYYSSDKKFVLTPHRFEYCNGKKHYFDQAIVRKDQTTSYKYAENLKISFDDASFTVFQNPHAAFYCLNKEQMQLWKNSGYKWKNKVVAFGVLESAATFSLYENFEFFKPHPDNIGYFEVQHFGNKYMLQHKIVEAV